MKSKYCGAFVVLWLSVSVFNNVSAQVFPSKPVRWIVPFPPGGTGDFVVRTVSGPMTKSMGQNVIVDFRPGGTTIVGTELTARAPADGYTLLFVANSFTINPAVRSKLPYNTLNDFSGVARMVITPFVIAVHPSLPAKSFQELLRLARARPGELTYGTAGTAGGQHLAGELLSQMAKVSLVHVPYQGIAPLNIATIGGQVTIAVTNVPDAAPYVAANRLRALAVTSISRSPAMKDIPTVAELGYPGYEMQLWIGAVVLRATARDAVNRLSTEIVRALEQQEVKVAFDKLGLTPSPQAPEQFDAFIRAEMRQNERIAKQANIRVD